MNEQQYNKFNKDFGTKFTSYTKEVDPDQLIQFGQIARVKGDLQENINRYAGQFLNGKPQKVPISAVPIPGSNGYWVPDGVTRGRAKQTAKRSDPEQKVLINTFAHEVLDYNQDQWEDFQDSANDHLGAQPSTDSDLKAAVARRIKTGRLDSIIKGENQGERLDSANPKEVERYTELGGKWFASTIFPNCGKTWKYFSNEIKRGLSQSAKFPTRIKTHTDEDLQKNYSDLGGTSYDLANGTFKHISNNERAFVLRENSRLAPNLYGSFVQHLITSPTVDFTVIVNYGNVLSKEDSDIVSDRNEVVSSIKKMIDLMRNFTCRVTVKSIEQIDSDPAGFQTLWDSNKTPGKRLSAVDA